MAPLELIDALVLQNRFAEIEPMSDPQNEALFEILNPEDVFAIIRRLAMENQSYSSAFQIFAENYFQEGFLIQVMPLWWSFAR